MNKPRRTKRQNSRPTIGFLTVPLTKEYRALMWSGVADVSRERGTNAICFPGGKLRSPNSPQARHEPYDRPQRNVLYDLVSTETLDGLVIWGWVGSVVGPEEFRDLLEHFRPLPLVSIALALEGIPAVLADNYGGMRDEIVHLIEVHGYRRIAFIRSEQKDYEEHEDRYRAYTDTLAEYGLPFDPDPSASASTPAIAEQSPKTNSQFDRLARGAPGRT